MIGTWIAIACALPFAVIPVVAALRVRNSVSLDQERDTPPDPAPPVSVIIPARNEAHNIEACLRSVLRSDYPNLEIVVVDDHSEDGTGDIARRIAAEDARVRVVDNPPLPEGWFGKQWACQTGATASKGEILFFTDADTVHASDLATRSVNGMMRRRADLFTVAGRQEIVSFWEKLVQPQVFAIMALRFGGSESVTQSRRKVDKIANGQCLLIPRGIYEAAGGHGLVKSHVADDLMLAQRYFAAGRRVVCEAGLNQLTTRMYTSLRGLIEGWGKNVFAAGRDSAWFGKAGRALYPLLLPLAPLAGVLPALILLASLLFAVPHGLVLWAAIVQVCLLAWWIFAYVAIAQPWWYALLSPLGAAMTTYIFLRAVFRGQKVEWKGREYRSA